MKFQFVRIHKLPPVDCLYVGSRFIVSASKKLKIIPKVSIQVFATIQGQMPGLRNLWGRYRASQKTEIGEKTTGIWDE